MKRIDYKNYTWLTPILISLVITYALIMADVSIKLDATNSGGMPSLVAFAIMSLGIATFPVVFVSLFIDIDVVLPIYIIFSVYLLIRNKCTQSYKFTTSLTGSIFLIIFTIFTHSDLGARPDPIGYMLGVNFAVILTIILSELINLVLLIIFKDSKFNK